MLRDCFMDHAIVISRVRFPHAKSIATRAKLLFQAKCK